MTTAEQAEFSTFIENNFKPVWVHEIAENTSFLGDDHPAAQAMQKMGSFGDLSFLVLNNPVQKTATDISILLMESLYYKRKYEAAIAVNTIIENIRIEA